MNPTSRPQSRPGRAIGTGRYPHPVRWNRIREGQTGAVRLDGPLPGGIQLAAGFQVVEQGDLIDRIVRLVHVADGAKQRSMVGLDEIVLEQHREDVLADVLRAHTGGQDDRLLLRGDNRA